MPLRFEWDADKARSNTQKHAVTFEEASTTFADPLSVTISDPLHSECEDRFVLIGYSHRNRLLVVAHTYRGDRGRIEAGSSVPGRQRERSNVSMKKKTDPDMLEEYDFSRGVRGKYAKKYAAGTNVVVVDPDVAMFYPDHDSVNDALRHLAAVIERQRKADGTAKAGGPPIG